MSEKHPPKKSDDEPVFYEIRIKGHLDDWWAKRFDGLYIVLAENGDTLLTGAVIDQAALYGLLKKVRDLGMALVSVNQVQSQDIHPNCLIKE